jgi:phage terminase large subunit-like protein
VTTALADLREYDADLRRLNAAPNRDELVAGLSTGALVALHDRMRLVAHSRKTRPLAWARLWHREAPLTSQRLAVQGFLDDGVRTAFLMGGNRSGKSEAGSQVDQAFGLGGDHPDVVAWAALNKLDIHNIPRGPGLVWVDAPTHADSRRYVRSKHDALMPAGSRWRARDADNEAELYLAGGGKIVFKAVNQRREGHQGDSVRLVSFDEEPDDLDVVSECRMRLADQDGRMLLRMTPLSGWTPLLRRYVRERDEHTKVCWLHGTDNPHVPPHILRELLAKYGEHERRARERGEITAMEGRIYSTYSDEVHVVDWDPPAHWLRFIVCDWGTSVPSCIVMLAWNPDTDTVVVVDEWYQAGSTIPERADVIKGFLRKCGHAEFIWADPEDASTNNDLILIHDLPINPAYKAVKYGINVVSARLAPDVNGRVHLLFHRRCVNTRTEIESYVWAGPDKPMKRDDHAMDTVRYGCVGIAMSYGVGAQPGPDATVAA